MIPFSYRRAVSIDDAVGVRAGAGDRLLGGGTNLIDLMRKGVETPTALVDVTGLSDAIEQTEGGGLLIGAAARNSVVAANDIVRSRYPVLARAILAGASAQIRNMATVGGNLMQRTRCLYFQDATGSRCNKRIAGSGCDAIEGINRYNAVIGGSSHCVAVHPSDMCVALAALDATIHIAGARGKRTIAVADFHRLPEDRPDLETWLEPREVIVAIEIPASVLAARSAYRKVRDRASYAFALVSVAAAVSMRANRIDDIRIAFGGVAPKPWRAFQAEAALRGAALSDEAVAAATALEFAKASPLAGNGFKIELANRTLRAVLADLCGGDR